MSGDGEARTTHTADHSRSRRIGGRSAGLRARAGPIRVGGALWETQKGGRAAWAKPLKGYGGSGVVEIIDDHDGATYRALYTVRLEGFVYVLHAFQKKSKSGIATTKKDLALIETRLRRAEEDYRQWRASETKTR